MEQKKGPRWYNQSVDGSGRRNIISGCTAPHLCHLQCSSRVLCHFAQILVSHQIADSNSPILPFVASSGTEKELRPFMRRYERLKWVVTGPYMAFFRDDIRELFLTVWNLVSITTRKCYDCYDTSIPILL